MQEGTKKTIIWETNSEPPRNYIWVRPDGVAYEYDYSIREWVVSPNIDQGGTNVVTKTTAEWDATVGYVPAVGEIIVYSDYKQIEKGGQLIDVPGIKVGNGVAYVQDLAFVGNGEGSEELEEHIQNTIVHTNAEEKDIWDNKVGIDDSEVGSEKLIFV